MYFTLCEATDREETIAEYIFVNHPLSVLRGSEISSRSVLSMCPSSARDFTS